MKPHQGERGATLVELLTGLVFASVLALLTSTWAQAVMIDSRRQQQLHELQQEVAMALDILAAEVRSAGFSAAAPIAPIAVAARERIEIHSDFDGDGTVAGSHERIVFSYRASNDQLTRASGAGSAQLLADNIPSGGFALSYFAADGGQMMLPATGLTAAQRTQIRSVGVRLIAQQTFTDGRQLRAEGSTRIALRNGR